MKKILIIVLLSVLVQVCSFQSFTYDEEISKNLVGFSTLAYCSSSNIPLNNCGPPCARNPSSLVNYYVLSSNKTDTQGIVGYSSDHDAIVITFRGTISTDLTNWMYNLDFVKTQFNECSLDNCKVHSGFFDSYSNIKDQLSAAFTILRNQYPTSKVYLTGHSLGAAIATLALKHIYQLNSNQQIDAFYNFGSPRVGNSVFANWLVTQNMAKLYGRITDAQDPVIHAPPSNLPFNFQHINQEIYYKDFSSENSPYILCATYNDPNCKRSSIIYSITNHLVYFGWNISDYSEACR